MATTAQETAAQRLEDNAFAAAQSQIEAMAGEWNSTVRLRLIDQRYDTPKKQRRHAIQLHGSLGDDEFCRELWAFNRDGYEVYVVAQEALDTLPDDTAINASHITSGRVIVADFDDKDFPDNGEYWHIAPTFILRRANSDRYFWAVWQTGDYPSSQIRDIHKRIIQRYASDPSIHDKARIFRLAGFISHKREEQTYYSFEAGSAKAASLAAHQALLPKSEDKVAPGSDRDSDDCISEERLRHLLKSIDPGCKRSEWIGILGAIKDATITRSDQTIMEPEDQAALADEWSSGELGNFKPMNYTDSEDVTRNLDSLTRTRGEDHTTIGSLVHAAKAAGMDEVTYQRLVHGEQLGLSPVATPKPGEGAPESPTETQIAPAIQALCFLNALAEVPEPAWAIDGILPENSYSLIYGRRSTKKSFLALDMGLSLATGTPWHGRAVKQGLVVYFAGEGFRGNRQRIEAWFKERKLELADYPRDFVLAPLTSKWDTPRGREIVRQQLNYISEVGPISLMIIDTARRAMAGDENAPTSVGQFIDGVGDLCREFGCSSLVLHHAGKDESRGARGGGPFEDDADAVFHLTRGIEGVAQLACTKQKDADSDWAMTFRADQITLDRELDGKPITSLVLTLEKESKSGDNTGDLYLADGLHTMQDAIAIQILKNLQDPFATRAQLATAVMSELAPELRDKDPNAFERAYDSYRKHLTRLSVDHALWPYIGKKNAKGQALTFTYLDHRGQRDANEPPAKALNYSPIYPGED